MSVEVLSAVGITPIYAHPHLCSPVNFTLGSVVDSNRDKISVYYKTLAAVLMNAYYYIFRLTFSEFLLMFHIHHCSICTYAHR